MKYVTPIQYAKLCGVSSQAIYSRLAKGLIEKVQIPDPAGVIRDYIDVDKYPPVRLRSRRSKE